MASNKYLIKGYYQPRLQIRPKSIIIYSEWNGPQSKALKTFLQWNMTRQQKTQYSGEMSPGSRKRMTKAINIMTQCIRPQWIYNEVSKRMVLHRLSFITLTVSAPTGIIAGKESYKALLSHFLQWMRRTKKVCTYIWKAELQQNGQIHYHITTPSFINYQEIRDKWNNLQNKAGIIEKYRQNQQEFHKEGFKPRPELFTKKNAKTGITEPYWTHQQQYEAYKKGVKENWSNPNSTDIHEVEKINDLSSYMVKELTKSMQNSEALDGKVWDCSQNLKSYGYYTVNLKEEHELFIKECLANKSVTSRTEERYTIIKFNEPPAERLLTKKEFANYTTYFNIINSIGERRRSLQKKNKEVRV